MHIDIMNVIIYNNSIKNHRKEIINMFDGEKILKWLDDHHVTQYKLARMTGLEQSTISRIVSGIVDPNGRTIVKICRVTGFTPNDLLIVPDEEPVSDCLCS